MIGTVVRLAACASGSSESGLMIVPVALDLRGPVALGQLLELVDRLDPIARDVLTREDRRNQHAAGRVELLVGQVFGLLGVDPEAAGHQEQARRLPSSQRHFRSRLVSPSSRLNARYDIGIQPRRHSGHGHDTILNRITSLRPSLRPRSVHAWFFPADIGAVV